MVSVCVTVVVVEDVTESVVIEVLVSKTVVVATGEDVMTTVVVIVCV